MMPDGYGFLRSSDYTIYLQMIFTYRHLKLDYLVLKLETLLKEGSSTKRRREIFPLVRV
jgi:hypothetical protein